MEKIISVLKDEIMYWWDPGVCHHNLSCGAVGFVPSYWGNWCGGILWFWELETSLANRAQTSKKHTHEKLFKGSLLYHDYL